MIILQKNGNEPQIKQTKHTNYKYFFIKDRKLIKDIDLTHFLMKQIIDDPFTKTLQGHKFQWFRSEIMNVPEGVTNDKFTWMCKFIDCHGCENLHPTGMRWV